MRTIMPKELSGARDDPNTCTCFWDGPNTYTWFWDGPNTCTCSWDGPQIPTLVLGMVQIPTLSGVSIWTILKNAQDQEMPNEYK